MVPKINHKFMKSFFTKNCLNCFKFITYPFFLIKGTHMYPSQGRAILPGLSLILPQLMLQSWRNLITHWSRVNCPGKKLQMLVLKLPSKPNWQNWTLNWRVIWQWKNLDFWELHPMHSELGLELEEILTQTTIGFLSNQTNILNQPLLNCYITLFSIIHYIHKYVSNSMQNNILIYILEWYISVTLHTWLRWSVCTHHRRE